MLSKYAIWMDGDNFLGISYAETKSEAIELCSNPFKEYLTARKRGDTTATEKGFYSSDCCDDEDIKDAGFKSKHHASMGIF